MLTSIFMITVSGTLFWMAALTLWWMLHAWRTPETLAGTSLAAAEGVCGLGFSLLVPARHEQQVLEHTVKRLLESSHTDYEILVIVGHDDPLTAEVAVRMAEQAPGRVQVVTDTHEVKNKPKALSTALPHCPGGRGRGLRRRGPGPSGVALARGPRLPRHRGGRGAGRRPADQLPLQLVQPAQLPGVLLLFRSRLHLHASKGFVPLGGNTMFVRTEVLRAAGGWDQNCLAEDCDLGVRLSSGGAKVVVAYDSAMVTREETPDTLYSLLKQRTQWNQGFLHVYRKKEWKRLPSQRQRMLAWWTLTTPFLQAFSGVVIPVDLVLALTVKLPVSVALFSFVPAVPSLATFAFEAVALHDFGVQYRLPVRPAHYVKLIAGGPLYQVVLAGAALRAVWREHRGNSSWELTRHVGAHLGG